MSVEPFEDFTEYGDPTVEKKAWEDRDPLVALGEVLPSYYQWTLKLPEKVRTGHLRRAYEALRGLSAAEIQQAAEQIARMERPPRQEAIPAEVRRIAASIRTRRIDQSVGEKTIACQKCQDLGLLFVYDPETVRWYEEGALPPAYGGNLVVYQCVVRCPCPAGSRRPKYIAAYEPRRHVLVEFNDVALDTALHHGMIEPIRLDLGRHHTMTEAIANGLPKYQAELAKRRQQLGLPPLVQTASPLRKTVQEVIRQAS